MNINWLSKIEKWEIMVMTIIILTAIIVIVHKTILPNLASYDRIRIKYIEFACIILTFTGGYLIKNSGFEIKINLPGKKEKQNDKGNNQKQS